MTTLLRAYRPQDLGQILEPWGADGEKGSVDGISIDQSVDLLNSPGAVAIVADDDGRLVGVSPAAVASP